MTILISPVVVVLIVSLLSHDFSIISLTVSKKNSKKIIDNPLFKVLGNCNKKKNDNCMITSIGQKINLSSEGWDPFNKE